MTTVAPPRRLSARELQVIAGLARGGDDVAIGRALLVSRFTVSVHVERACAAVGISGQGRRAALVNHAYRAGLLAGLAPEVRRRARLTVRAVEVLQGMAGGLTNAQIAYGMGGRVSVDSVHGYAAALFGELGAYNRAHAVALGWQQELLGSSAGRGRRA